MHMVIDISSSQGLCKLVKKTDFALNDESIILRELFVEVFFK